MIRHIKNVQSFSNEFLSIISDYFDRMFLYAREPKIRGYSRQTVFNIASEIRHPYCRYMLNCTKDDMPITFSQACFLLYYVNVVSPSRILDLGSGFSTYIFSYYLSQRKHDLPVIYSVDDSEYWLDQTKLFIKNENYYDKQFLNFETWETINQMSLPKFDFVFVDIGSLDFRAKNFEHITQKFLGDGGRLFVDDMHFLEYKKSVLQCKDKNGMRGYSITSFCQDEYQKQSCLFYSK